MRRQAALDLPGELHAVGDIRGTAALLPKTTPAGGALKIGAPLWGEKD